MSNLNERRKYTTKRFADLQALLVKSEQMISNAACVYATGSFGRGEAGPDSDLDLFIVSKTKTSEQADEANESRLRRLDEIRLKASLIDATKELGIKEFDGDGKYLVHYTINDLKKNLGTPDDDAINTFTARLLLLLESRPLLGNGIYSDIVEEIIGAYWQDFPDHQHEFVPAFLANDILRLWRTFCVNYEVRTFRAPEEKNIKRRQKNYTLKHSRLLTCYSGLLYLLAIFSLNNTVTPGNLTHMVGMTPTERLEYLLTIEKFSPAFDAIGKILNNYDEFLLVKSDPVRFHQMFADGDEAKKHMKAAHKIAELFFEAIEKVGGCSRLHRLLLV